MSWILPVGLAVKQVSSYLDWYIGREEVFKQAREEADRLNRPLINYGCSYSEPMVSQSDYNVDIVERDVPNFVLVDPGGPLPFPDDSGVVYASHVLEHTDDPRVTLEELERVGPTYVVLPSVWSISNWLNPKHKHLIVGDLILERPSKWAIPVAVGSFLLKLL